MSGSSSRTVDGYIDFLRNCFLYVLDCFGDTLLVEDVSIGEEANVGGPVITMYLRDFSCSLALVGGGGNVLRKI